jgi:small subunit ribosomal protein S1
MAALLDQEDAAYRELRRGEIVEGTVVGTDRGGVLVDIGAKSEGVIPPNEMNCLQPKGADSLSIGDKVLVAVVQPESHEGQVILSMDRARGEHGWRVLQDHLDNSEAFEAHVSGSNKGGLLVNVEGVNAFVPLSQIVAGPDRSDPDATQRALNEWVGKPITLKVIELNRRRNRAILSERSAMQEKRAAEKERLLQELEEGDVRTGRITSIRDFGIFVDIGGADGLVHLSELSWERTPRTPADLFKVGDEVPVFVLKIDNEAKKIALSVRRAQPERWEEIVQGYREGQIVPGQVTKLAPFGAFVRLEGPIEGLIHISELVDRRITHPKEVVEESDVVPVKIVRIEYDRHRLGLSLKQARDSAEESGWEFSPSGGAISAPQESLERLGLTEMPRRAVSEEAVPEAAAEVPVEAIVAVEASAEATEVTAEESPEEATTEEPAVAEAAEEAPAAAEEPVTEGVAEEEPAPEPAAEEEPAAEAEDAEATAEQPAAEAVADEAPASEAEDAKSAAEEEPAAEAVEADDTSEVVTPEETPESEDAPPAEETPAEAEEESALEQGIEAAAEGAAPDITEDVTEAAEIALNNSGASE